MDIKSFATVRYTRIVELIQEIAALNEEIKKKHDELTSLSVVSKEEKEKLDSVK